MSNGESQNQTLYAVIAAAIVVIAVQVLAVPHLVNSKIVAREVDQVGGQENYDKIFKYQQSQASEFAGQLNNDGTLSDAPVADNGADEPANNEPTFTDEDTIAKVKEGAHFKGNKDAKILWIEYSDLECPFCKRLHDNGTITDLEEKYGDDLVFSFQHYPLPFHNNAARAAEAAECAAEAGWEEKYFEYVEAVFALGTPTNDGNLKQAAQDVGLSGDEIMACADEGKFADKIQDQMDTGNSAFGVTGTPGNVLINMETREYRVISGAYPTSEFITNIDAMLGN